ncbi:MAG: UDP-3-O-(3-hydroxymyristoyl)glucosamine N-acyltransferase [Pseudomonadota bacterium]
MFSLAELADRFGLKFTGENAKTVSGIATLIEAGPEDISFLANRKYLSHLYTTRAAAVILSAEMAADCPVGCLVTDTPYLAFARISQLFDQSVPLFNGVHPSAVIAESAEVDASASIGPHVVIEHGVTVGREVELGAGAYVGPGCQIGARTRVLQHAVIYRDVTLGEDCVIHPQAVLGADGFGFAGGPNGWEKVAQLGGVCVGSGVEIGAGTTIDRGALGDTVIGDGVIIDNQVQVGHNCHIGDNTAIAGCVGLAGSTVIGKNCTLAGGVGVVGHVEICDNVHVTGMTMVTKSITRPGSFSSGTPMADTARWKRNAVRFSQLESIQQRLTALEKKDTDTSTKE